MSMPTPTPTPITFILEELNFGGTQRQTLELACRLDRSRFSPRIWTLWQGMDMLAQAQQAHAPVTSLTSLKHLQTRAAIMGLWRALRQERPRVLHLCTSFPNIWGRVLGKLTQVPHIVASCRGQGNVQGQHERYLHRLAQAHICNAQSIAKALQRCGVPAAKIHYIPNGVDTDVYTPAPTRTPQHILCVGRMVPEKEHGILLQAFALLKQRMPEVQLHLLGDGPLCGEISHQIMQLGLKDSVHLHGASDDVCGYMQKMGVLALASSSEGMPNVLMEGMACGLPVVACRVGGIPDVVVDGTTGILVPPHDAHAFADALERAISPQGDTMGRAGRASMLEHFSLDHMVKQHEAVYDSL